MEGRKDHGGPNSKTVFLSTCPVTFQLSPEYWFYPRVVGSGREVTGVGWIRESHVSGSFGSP